MIDDDRGQMGPSMRKPVFALVLAFVLLLTAVEVGVV